MRGLTQPPEAPPAPVVPALEVAPAVAAEPAVGVALEPAVGVALAPAIAFAEPALPSVPLPAVATPGPSVELVHEITLARAAQKNATAPRGMVRRMLHKYCPENRVSRNH